ncbi:MAG: S1 RNA-binding domain-containing protein [Anaerolineales bacterium]|nr:MAG: S1 RNA-binding domain-containing protein [Anaerolineales bacterium]
MSEQETSATASAVEEKSAEAHGAGDKSAPLSIQDLKPGMELRGKVKSTTDFGAFVDMGIAQDGLVHISELVRRRVSKVSDVVAIGDEVQVWVKKVDKKRGRISLTMVRPVTRRFKELKPEMVVDGVVTRMEPYGVFVDIGTGRDGLVHVSELTEGYIGSVDEVVSVGDKVQVRVLKVDRKARKVDLSMKEFTETPAAPAPEPVVEQSEPTPTVMALAFQAAIKDDDRTKSKQDDIEKLIAASLRH